MNRIILVVLIIGVSVIGIFIASTSDMLKRPSEDLSPEVSLDPVGEKPQNEDDDYQYEVDITIPLPSVSAKSYLIGDLNSGFLFVQKNSEEVLPIASLTKLMTALVVVENVDLGKAIEITPEMTEAYGITEGLVEGERFRAGQLFYPLLIESSNDAAEALVGLLGRQHAIELMNEKAGAILMEQTRFVDPSGFDIQNVSTAQDLFYLAKYILQNQPAIWDITKGRKVPGFDATAFDTEKFWDKNLFTPDTSLLGAKSGYLKESKFSGVFVFRFRSQDQTPRAIALIVLGSGNGKRDIQRLYGWVQKSYSLEPDYAS